MSKKAKTLQEKVSDLLDVYSQVDLGVLIGTSQASISRIFTGKQTDIGYEAGKEIDRLHKKLPKH